MKRLMVFAAASVAFLGLLAGPAAAEGGLKKFNIDDIGYTYSGYAIPVGILQCNPSMNGPTGYDITISITQGSTSGFGFSGAPCSGQTEHWQGNIVEQNGPFYPGKAKVCANAAKHFEYTSTAQTSAAVCKTVKLVYAP